MDGCENNLEKYFKYIYAMHMMFSETKSKFN